MPNKLTQYDEKAIESGHKAIKFLNETINQMTDKVANSNGKEKGDAYSFVYHLEEVKSDLSRVLSDIEYGK